MRSILSKVSQSYFFIVVLALLLGVFFSKQTAFLEPYSTYLLGAIFFLSAFKIDFKKVWKHIGDGKMLLVVNIFMLVALPIAVYFLSLKFAPELALALLLLSAMPSGMTAPFLVEIIGGKQNLALVLTVLTSLLAPFTVPLVIKTIAGVETEVSFWNMFLSLAKVIFLPFVLASIVKSVWSGFTEKVNTISKPISTVFLALLIIGVVAKQAPFIKSEFLTGGAVNFLGYLFLFFLFLHIAGYFVIFWRSRKDRITIAVCLTYMNFTLAIYLADKFFQSPTVLVLVVLAVIPWTLLLIPFKLLMRKFTV